MRLLLHPPSGPAVAPLWPLNAIAAGASPAAPLTGLSFATFAANLAQELAPTVSAAAALMADALIPLAWCAPEPLEQLCRLLPPFWVSEAYWMALDCDALWPAPLALGNVP